MSSSPDVIGNSPYRRISPVLCAAVAVACFVNTLPNGFCEDDVTIVVQNPMVTAADAWRAIWLTDYWHPLAQGTPHRDLLYRPLPLVTYRLNHLIGGLDSIGYHVVNVGLHAMISALVCHLGLLLSGSTARGLLAGLIFAALPIHTEAVDNVVGRAELLMTLFTLVAAGAALPVHSDGRASRIALRSTLIGLAMFGAMASKESGLASAPLVLIFSRYRQHPGTGHEPTVAHADGQRSLPWRALVVPLTLSITAYAALRYAALGGKLHESVVISRTVNALAGAPLWERFYAAWQQWGMYWAKTFWPRVLVVDYSINAVAPANRLADAHVLLGLAVTAALCLICWISWRRGDRMPALLLAALLLSYLPVSNTLVLIKTFFAERLWYGPSAWASILIAWFLTAMMTVTARFHTGPRNAYQSTIAGLAAILVVAGSVRCWIRNREWRNNGTLYAAAYRDHPNALRVLYGYGQWLIDSGRLDEAIDLLEQSVLIDVGFTDGHRELGAALLQAGRPSEALEHLILANAQVPNHGPTIMYLDHARKAVAGQHEEETAALAAQVNARPDDLDLLLQLTGRLTEQGQAAYAVDLLAAAQSRFESDMRYWHRLAEAHLLSGNQAAGIATYRRARRLAPDDVGLASELAMLLLDRGEGADLGEARELIEHAFVLDPQNIQVRLGRAELLSLDGKRLAAAKIYRSIAASLPPEHELRQYCLMRAGYLEK